MKRRYKLLVFDWDGTLMDSQARIVDCMQAGFRDNGFDAPSGNTISNFIGLGLIEAVRELSPGFLPTQQQRIADAYREHFLVHNDTPSRFFDGATETLKKLRADGYMLAVATGKSRRGLDEEFEKTGIRGMFELSRCAGETRSKPHPDMLQEIMDILGLMAAETLMIGDTEFDMLMARNAGADALAVSYGVHDRERLLKTDPVGIVDDVSHIPDWVSSSRNNPAPELSYRKIKS